VGDQNATLSDSLAETNRQAGARMTEKPSLSLILCSRNDEYMGNSRWRLQTSLNYVAQQASALGREAAIEVLVADWGSEVPLREVLKLAPAAARMTSFIWVPPAIARPLQRDSPFPEVLALNAAARRANGDYIGRIDQDTLVGKRFLDSFFEMHDGRHRLPLPFMRALLFSNVRVIPYRFAVRCPDLALVDRFVRWFGSSLPLENARSRETFYADAVGIWLLHRDLWNECGGYDERMIYMNAMETNMVLRLQMKYQVVDLGRIVRHDFFHLEHYHPWMVRKSSIHRKVNAHLPFSQPDALNASGNGWGLARCPLEALPAKRESLTSSIEGHGAWTGAPKLVLAMIPVGLQMIGDWFIVSLRRGHAIWTRRVKLACRAVQGQRLVTWPRLLGELWAKNRSARRHAQQ
jgi:hypothetical protein